MAGTLHINSTLLLIALRFTNVFFAFSLFALLVMNFDRYLPTSYPFFHRTSVTKRRHLTLLTIQFIVQMTLAVLSVNSLVISREVYTLILFVLLSPPMLFINCKLFLIIRKSRGNDDVSLGISRTFSLKHISSCLLAVACYLVLSIPVFVYIGLKMSSTKTSVYLNNADLAGIWAETIASMNCTFNCLIFYWKDKVLRVEGMKVIKSMKIFRSSSVPTNL